MNDFEKKLRAALTEKRFIHSLGVRDEAVRMARLFGADEDKAYTAGLLHDCAKCLTREEERAVCEKYGYTPDRATLLCHPVLHAPLGAILARHEYGVTDKEILDAIRYHTTARAGMTLPDKIIYVADMTEPGRDFEGAAELRELSRSDIDRAFILALRSSLMFNLKKGSFIHPDSLSAWNYMIEKENL